jgi:O-antigen/teichoic acid export membrane protein
MPTQETTLPVAEAFPDSADRRAGLAALPDSGTGAAASDAAIYAAGVYAAQIVAFVAGIILKGLLGPRLTGYWTLVSMLMVFLALAPLGVFDGATRQVPAERGRGRFSRAAALADTAASFTVATFALGGIVIAAIALAFGGGWPPEVRYGLVALGLLAPLRAFVDCHTLIYQITKRFAALAAGLLLTALIALAVQTVLVYFLGYWGMFVGLGVSLVGSLVLWQRLGLAGLRRPAFRWRIDFGRVAELLPVGIPIMLFGQIWLLFMAIDSLLVARLLDATQLGYYALGVSVTSYILLLPKSIGAALFPRMQERFAPERDVGAIRRYAVDVQAMLALSVIPLLVGSAFFLVPVLIRQALPAFIPGISVVHILVAGSFLIALVHMPIELRITTGRRWPVTILLLGCLAFNAAANYVAMGVLDEGIKGAAFATALSYFVLLLATTVYGLRLTLSPGRLARHLALILGAFAYVVGILWAIELPFEPSATIGAVEDVAIALAKLAFFGVAVAPLLLLAERRYAAVSTAWSLLVSGYRRGVALVGR